MTRFKPCESAEAKDGIHKFDRSVHTRATPCIFCGEPRDLLVLLGEEQTLPRSVELQIAGLSDAEEKLPPARIAILISTRLMRNSYQPAWGMAEIRAEVIKQLTVTGHSANLHLWAQKQQQNERQQNAQSGSV